jgi:predicted RNA-binding Zn ribbon-like protein
MQAGDVTRVRLVGGSLGLDFVNTRTGPPSGSIDDDVLGNYDDLVSWARYAGAISQAEAERLRRAAKKDRPAAEAAFARALRMRADLDNLFRALARGRAADGGVLERLRADESEAIRHAELAPGRPFAWRWDDDRSLARPLWPAVHAAMGILLSGPLDRVKQCGGCSFLFLDETKNRSRRWCSMDDCGTDEKMRRYVASRRASRSTQRG